MKKIFFIVFLQVFCIESFAQLNREQLSKETTITVKDLLDLRLQTLAAQITSGSYRIIDMGSLTYPIFIRIESDLKIVFEIEGNLQSDLSKNVKEDIIKEGMIFMQTAISELLIRNFPNIDFDRKKDIVGYWYFGEGYIPLAKWENENLIWLCEP